MTEEERLREELDLKRREDYRSELETFAHPLDARAEASIEHGVGYGQAVVRAGMGLNGGALIALPALVVMFNIDAPKIKEHLLAAALAFVIGLLSAVLVAAAGYFNFMSVVSELRWQANDARIKAAERYLKPYGQEYRPTIALPSDRQRTWVGRATFATLIAGISLSLLSGAAFVFGTLHTSSALLAAPEKAPLFSAPITAPRAREPRSEADPR